MPAVLRSLPQIADFVRIWKGNRIVIAQVVDIPINTRYLYEVIAYETNDESISLEDVTLFTLRPIENSPAEGWVILTEEQVLGKKAVYG